MHFFCVRTQEREGNTFHFWLHDGMWVGAEVDSQVLYAAEKHFGQLLVPTLAQRTACLQPDNKSVHIVMLVWQEPTKPHIHKGFLHCGVQIPTSFDPLFENLNGYEQKQSEMCINHNNMVMPENIKDNSHVHHHSTS